MTCHPATRVALLRQIQDWAQQPQSKSIFWLNGAAGTGKSTISRTFAEWLTGQDHTGVVGLGASIFLLNEVKATEVPLQDSFPLSLGSSC
jgi:pantothenate kinase-related protein Tda10